MKDTYTKLARIFRTTPEVLLQLDQKMTVITDQEGVMEAVMKENQILVDRTLTEFGLTRASSSDQIHAALMERLIHLDQHLFETLGRPDLAQVEKTCGTLCEMAFRVYTPPRGTFIKRERVTKLLEKYPPDTMLSYFGYQSVEELIEQQGFASVVSALRFTQSKEWMHKFFDEAYSELTADDFEEREVELKVLDTEWLKVAEKFLAKKHHNVSHLKEFGVIFVTPIVIDRPGETMRMFTLMLHYLHEVPFYSGLIRKFMHDADFTTKLKSLLRGDVPAGPLPEVAPGKIVWRVVQQYLAKDDENDFRLMEHHVNPEAEHWLRAEEDLGRLSRLSETNSEAHGRVNLGYWTGLDFVGDFFKDASGKEQLVSFDLIDLVMSLVDQSKQDTKYLYHHQEALWNKLFIEYVGRDRMNQLIEENIIKGFIIL